MSSGTTLFKKHVNETLIKNSLKIQFYEWLESKKIERGAGEESERIIAHKFLVDCLLVPNPIEPFEARQMIYDYVYEKVELI